MLLNIEHKEARPGVLVVSLSGKLLLGAESQRIESLVPEWIATGYRSFVFDLSGISHIDSTGIGRCIFSFNKILQAGGKMAMAGALGQVREAFRVTRLDTVFRFYPDAEAALSALKPS